MAPVHASRRGRASPGAVLSQCASPPVTARRPGELKLSSEAAAIRLAITQARRATGKDPRGEGLGTERSFIAERSLAQLALRGAPRRARGRESCHNTRLRDGKNR